MKKPNKFEVAILIVTIQTFVGFGVVYLSVGFDMSKVNLSQVCYALVVGSPLILSTLVYLAFKRFTKDISSRGLIVFLKVVVLALAILVMLLLNYIFTYFINGEITTEYIRSLILILFIGYGALFIEFKDGKICILF